MKARAPDWLPMSPGSARHRATYHIPDPPDLLTHDFSTLFGCEIKIAGYPALGITLTPSGKWMVLIIVEEITCLICNSIDLLARQVAPAFVKVIPGPLVSG